LCLPLGVLLLGACLGGTTLASAGSFYSVTDLGTLGGTESFAYAINDPGRIVGVSRLPGDTATHAFLYRKGQMTDLAPFDSGEIVAGPSDINNAAKVAGGVVIGGIYYPALLDSTTGEITPLGSLGGVTSYGFTGTATAVNNRGQAVGYSHLDALNRHAFLYRDGAMADLGSFGGYSGALDINDSGAIVGFASDTFNGRAHAFLYVNGVMTDLDPFRDTSFTWSENYARSINNRGQVAGDFLTQDQTAFHCFLYSKGEMTDLGTLGGPDCVPHAINERGDVVGTSLVQVGTETYCDPFTGTCYEYPVYSWHGFLYRHGRMIDLNTLIPPDSGWELNWVFDINNRGQIVGYGTVNGGDAHRAFLLTPKKR